jgi:hypothetical protein
VYILEAIDTIMLLNDDEIKERIESPLNLLNRLRTSLDRLSSPVPRPTHSQIPSLPPSASDIIPDLEDKIANNSTRSKAVGILNSAMDELSKRIPEVQKPEKLAQIAAEMSKVVSQQDSKNTGDSFKTAQIIVYAPQVQNIENYEVVEVTE